MARKRTGRPTELVSDEDDTPSPPRQPRTQGHMYGTRQRNPTTPVRATSPPVRPHETLIRPQRSPTGTDTTQRSSPSAGIGVRPSSPPFRPEFRPPVTYFSFTAPGQSFLIPLPRTLSPAKQAVQVQMVKLMQHRFEPSRYMDRTAL